VFGSGLCLCQQRAVACARRRQFGSGKSTLCSMQHPTVANFCATCAKEIYQDYVSHFEQRAATLTRLLKEK
jgi:predicted amidophosphoribosyltransferase